MFSLFRRLFLFCKSRSFTAETSRWFAAFKFAFEHIEFQVFHFERFKSFTSFGQIFPFLSAESAGLTNLNSLSAPRSGPLVRVKSKFEAKIWSIPYHFETVSVLSKHCFGRTSGSPEKLRANDDPVKFVSLWRPLQALRGSSIELIGLKFFDSFRMSCFFWGSLNWEDSGFKFQIATFELSEITAKCELHYANEALNAMPKMIVDDTTWNAHQSAERPWAGHSFSLEACARLEVLLSQKFWERWAGAPFLNDRPAIVTFRYYDESISAFLLSSSSFWSQAATAGRPVEASSRRYCA